MIFIRVLSYVLNIFIRKPIVKGDIIMYTNIPRVCTQDNALQTSKSLISKYLGHDMVEIGDLEF